DRDGAMNIYVMDADGSNVKQLTNSKGTDRSRAPAWSPDGKKIVFGQTVGTNGCALYTMAADGGNLKQLDENGWDPAWSSDGKSIVFQHVQDFESGPVYVIDANGGNRRELLKNELYVKGARPAWRPK